MKKLLATLAVALPLFGGAADHRANVEHGLLPAVILEGEPAMNLVDRMRRYSVPGLSIAVWKDGKVDWTAGYGDVKAETLLQAGSISKSLTAVTTLRVLARRKIALDTDVNDVLTSWKVPAKGVTPALILTHMAGLNVPGFPGFERGDPIPSLVDELEGRGNTEALRAVSEPGKSWSYSGGGYLVLQQLLMDLEKKPIDEIFEREVLGPAKMKESTFAQPLPPAWASRAASGRSEDDEPIAGGSYIFPEKTAAGLWTTAADLARFGIALQQNKLLTRAQTKTMLDKRYGVIAFGKSYFLHPGGNTGFAALYIFNRAKPEGVAMLANSENAEPLMFEIARAVAKEYAWPDYLPAPRTIIKSDSEVFRGRFLFDKDDLLTIKAIRGHLAAIRTAKPDAFLDIVAPNELVDRETGESYLFDGNTVKVGNAIATATRETIATDIMTRDIDQGIAQYETLDAALVTDDRLRARAEWLEKRDRPAAALALLKYDVKRHPQSAAALDALARAQEKNGDTAGARETSKLVLEALKTDKTPTASWRQVYRKRAERRLQ